jgi:hypothetical protein
MKGFCGSNDRDQETGPADNPGNFNNIGFTRLRLLVQVDEHQRIQEQYQYGAHVHDEIHNCQELRIHQDIMNGERKKRKDQVKNAMYRVFRSDNQYRKKYGQKCDEVKCTHGVTLQIPLPFKRRAKV